jgi:glycogen synthase
MQRRGMSTDVSWRGRAQRYADIYRDMSSASRSLT